MEVPSTSTAGPLAGVPSFPEIRWLTTEKHPGQETATAVVHESIEQLQKRVSQIWPKEGWKEEFGESEPGREVEGRWSRNGVNFGFKGRTLYCDKSWSHLLMAITRPS